MSENEKEEIRKKRLVYQFVIKMIWLVLVMIYLVYSIITNNWRYSWVIFIAGAIITECLMFYIDMKYGKDVAEDKD